MKTISVEEYEPFGDEWKKEISKMTKPMLVNLLRQKLIDLQNFKYRTEKLIDDIIKLTEERDLKDREQDRYTKLWLESVNEVERLKGIVSCKTFHDETEFLKLQVKDLEEHNEEIRNDYKIAIKILRLKYSDDEISTMWAENK